jgi:hypothetical protein
MLFCLLIIFFVLLFINLKMNYSIKEKYCNKTWNEDLDKPKYKNINAFITSTDYIQFY